LLTCYPSMSTGSENNSGWITVNCIFIVVGLVVAHSLFPSTLPPFPIPFRRPSSFSVLMSLPAKIKHVLRRILYTIRRKAPKQFEQPSGDSTYDFTHDSTYDFTHDSTYDSACGSTTEDRLRDIMKAKRKKQRTGGMMNVYDVCGNQATRIAGVSSKDIKAST